VYVNAIRNVGVKIVESIRGGITLGDWTATAMVAFSASILEVRNSI